MDRCEVEAIVRAAVEEVLAHVAESSHAVSERERTVLVGDEDNPSLATESYRDAGREASWAQRDFHGSWLWVAAIEALARQQFASKWAAGNVSPVRSKEHETRSWLVVKLHEFVRKVVSQADFSIDDAKWSGAFDALWTLLVEGIVVEGVYAPLYGIKLEQPVELDGGLTLRALDLGERSALYRDPTLNPRGLGLGAGDCRAALVCETRTQMGERRRPPTHTVRDVVRALRMFGHRAYAVFVRPE